jgi:hypothetical protein
MSRSYRKPIVKDGYGSKWKRGAKRSANKTVKHADEVPSGSAYKKFSNSWDICDFKFHIDPPQPGGKTLAWGVHYSEKEMARDYRKARRK